MLDIICSIFDMALIIIFFNAIMKKRREAVPFWLFLFIFFTIDIVILFYCRCVPSFTISIGCAPCSMCVFLTKLRSFLDNKCIIAFFLQFIFQSYCFIKRIIFPDLNCIIRILINDIPLVSICNRTIQNILCIRKITV